MCQAAFLDIKHFVTLIFEPQHDKTNKITCSPSEDSNQPGHPPSLIRVFSVRMKKHWSLCYLLSIQQKPWSDCADAQTNLSLRWAHKSFRWFYRAAAHLHFQCWLLRHFFKEEIVLKLIYHRSFSLANVFSLPNVNISSCFARFRRFKSNQTQTMIVYHKIF